MNRLTTLFLLLIFLAGAGCAAKARDPRLNLNPAQATTIRLLATGVVDLNDKPASLDEVATHLSKQKGVPGAHILYYREDAGGGEPHPNVVPLMKAIMDARLPIRMCSRRDFSDALGDYQKKN